MMTQLMYDTKFTREKIKNFDDLQEIHQLFKPFIYTAHNASVTDSQRVHIHSDTIRTGQEHSKLPIFNL